MKADLAAGTIVPVSAVDAPPRWTRESTLVTSLVFDGDACTPVDGPIDVGAGDVVVVEILNESSRPVGLVFRSTDTEFEGRLESLTAPGARNAIARRLPVGSYVVYCTTADGESDPLRITSHFAAACDVESRATEPDDVVRALDQAVNGRDTNAVCSLLAEDVVLSAPDMEFRGREVIASAVTPFDDDLWFQELVTRDLEVVDGAALWTYDYVGLWNTESFVARVTVVDGEIVRIEFIG